MKKLSPLIMLMMVGLWAGSALGDSFSSLSKKGNKAYKRGQELAQGGEKNKAVKAWEEALRYYRDAEIEKPENPELSYNIGNAIYRQEKYEDALERYFRALNSDELEHQAWTHYNLGNTSYRSGKYPEAIQAYQKCLELTPEDQDAKFNLEFVRKKMKEMLDKEAKRQQEQKQQEQPQPDQQQEQQQQSQEEEEQTREDQDQAQQPQDEQRQQEERREQLQPEEGMTEEDAERILNALKDDEKELLKKQKRAPRRGGRRGGKDW